MQALRVVCVVTIIVISSIFAEAAITPKSVGVSKTSSDRESQRDTHATTTNATSGKRFLRIEEATNANIMATGSMGDTSNNSSTEVASQEERGVRAVPLEVVGKQESASKFVKGNTITTAVTNLLRRNKERKILRKFRIKLLESLPPEQAANLIFLKRSKKELPAELPKKELPSKLPKKELPSKLPKKDLQSKLPKGIKGFDFKIPGVSNAIIRLKMEIWYYYRTPPSFVFKKLGLVGKGSGEKLHAQENYKYFKSYWEAWTDSQKPFDLLANRDRIK